MNRRVPRDDLSSAKPADPQMVDDVLAREAALVIDALAARWTAWRFESDFERCST
jgi:hypothetical protein